MALIANPASELLREPNLLVPRKKPVGQVKIDWSNSITEGLYASFNLNNGDPRVARDLVLGNDAYPHVTYGLYPALEHNANGEVRSPDDNTVLITNDAFNHGIGTGEFTWSVKITLDSTFTASGYQGLCSNGAYSPALYANLVTTWGLYLAGNRAANTSLQANKTYTLTVTRTGTTLNFYLNGEPDGTSSSSSSMANNPIGLFANRADISSENHAKGQYEYFQFFNRALSLAEIKSLYSDPYQFLIPA